MAGNVWAVMTAIGLALLLWTILIELRKTLLGIRSHDQDWYRRIVKDIPILVAAILILSIIGFTIYSFFNHDVVLAEKFWEDIDAFATGVWGFLIGYGPGREIGKKQAGVEEAVGFAESRMWKHDYDMLKEERDELKKSLLMARETIRSLGSNDEPESEGEDVQSGQE